MSDVRLRSPSGKLVLTDEFQARELLQRGYVLDSLTASAQQNIRRAKKERFTTPEQKIKGGAEALARGLTGGLSDVVLEDFGADTSERAQFGGSTLNTILEGTGLIGGSLFGGLGSFGS